MIRHGIQALDWILIGTFLDGYPSFVPLISDLFFLPFFVAELDIQTLRKNNWKIALLYQILNHCGGGWMSQYQQGIYNNQGKKRK